jgi:hypothetical protein
LLFHPLRIGRATAPASNSNILVVQMSWSRLFATSSEKPEFCRPADLSEIPRSTIM